MKFYLVDTKLGWIGLVLSPRGRCATTLPHPRRFRSLRDLDLLAQAYGRSRFGRNDALEGEESERLARAWAKLRATLAWQAVRWLWRRR